LSFRLWIKIVSLLFISLSLLTVFGCQQGKKQDRVCVIYASVDQNFSEPVLQHFQEKKKIRILPVYDVEATKTTGLVNRLIAEKDRPQADVFWSGEFAQTILLKEKDVLAPYLSPNAKNIPDLYKDPEGYWTGFSARARVLIVNTDLLTSQEYPASIFDLLQPRWPAEKIGIAYPVFGTTATHAAALYAFLGAEKARNFFQELYDRGVRVADGNATVRDLVSSGQLIMGLTDTDDACGAKRRGKPVDLVFLDQEENGLGTLLIPNTVAMVNGAPHHEEARILIDFLLSEDVEQRLIEAGWTHVPLRPLNIRQDCLENMDIKGMNISLQEVYQSFEYSKKELLEIFIR